MTSVTPPTQLFPNRGFSFFILGVSLHDILTRLKAQPRLYPSIDLSYSPSHPISAPVVLGLPANGLRLRFDGPDQRLRLIEVLDFTKSRLTYKNAEIVKALQNDPALDPSPSPAPTGPTFRQVYNRLFGPTFPGEYLPPDDAKPDHDGTYILSYPGVAFSFPLQSQAWTPGADFVSLLSSSAASPARSMAIFNGSSWPDARPELFDRVPPNPRSLLLAGRAKDGVPDEIELVQIHAQGRIQLLRKSGTSSLITLSETTPQDLVAELGPPDAIYRKNDRRLSIHRGRDMDLRSRHQRQSSGNGPLDLTDTDRSSAPESSDHEEEEKTTGSGGHLAAECFFNYFNHGFDVFISHPTSPSPTPAPATGTLDSEADAAKPHSLPTNQLTATKLLLHANVPGSYPFNRHRRSRWTLEHISTGPEGRPLDSEMTFDVISGRLKKVWKDTYAGKEEEKQLQRGMVLNRGWGDSPGSSCELLGGWEESVGGRRKTGDGVMGAEHGQGNTELFGFPGMIFEVLKNGTVSCLTVY